MVRGLVILIVLTSTVLRLLHAPHTDSRRAILKRFGQCKGFAALPIAFHDVAILPDPITSDKTLSFKVTVREEIGLKFAIVISLWRCDSSGNPDSCELFLKDFNVTNVCQVIGLKNELWSDFMDHLDIPSRCPLKVGIYTMSKCPINTNFLKYMPLSNALYKIKMTGWIGSKQVACVELEDQLIASYVPRRQ